MRLFCSRKSNCYYEKYKRNLFHKYEKSGTIVAVDADGDQK